MHRVYVHEGPVWTLATAYARRQPLPASSDEYVVYVTPRSASYELVCQTLDDGRRLCDVGPDHEHLGDAG
jgi:hypothetical protein